jgi:alkyl hydroperoxide reductase subunit AhpC
MICLGDLAPDFAAKTNVGSFDSFRAWKGDQWAILFSHPADFTPVCTTELGMVAKLLPEFEKRQTKVIGLSCDDVESHSKWIQDINETQNCKVTFPIIDDSSRQIASAYSMLDRNYFLIDKNRAR